MTNFLCVIFGYKDKKVYLCIVNNKHPIAMVNYFMSDKAIREELGRHIKQMRINARISQQELAEKAGIARATITNFENGKGGTIDSLIAILRHLQKLNILDAFETNSPISPIAMEEAAPYIITRVRNKKK